MQNDLEVTTDDCAQEGTGQPAPVRASQFSTAAGRLEMAIRNVANQALLASAALKRCATFERPWDTADAMEAADYRQDVQDVLDALDAWQRESQQAVDVMLEAAKG